MRITFALCALVAILALVATAPPTAGKTGAAQNAPATQPAAAGKGGEPAALEAKLLGEWEGGACVGDYTFKADGTFELRHFTPGGNTLTGTWSVRWDALPPTLVLTCKTSDFRKKDPTREEYQYLGKALELKLLELNSDSLVYRHPDHKKETRFERPTEK